MERLGVMRRRGATDLLAAGMVGLLLLGALLALLFASVSCGAQALAWTRQRRAQFAILRTLGLSGGELARLPLGELGIIVLFSMVGGATLGLSLSAATLPYLQFSATLLDATTLGGHRQSWSSIRLAHCSSRRRCWSPAA